METESETGMTKSREAIGTAMEKALDTFRRNAQKYSESELQTIEDAISNLEEYLAKD